MDAIANEPMEMACLTQEFTNLRGAGGDTRNNMILPAPSSGLGGAFDNLDGDNDEDRTVEHFTPNIRGSANRLNIAEGIGGDIHSPQDDMDIDKEEYYK